MILVDTSVWIELLNGKLGGKLSGKDLYSFATCGPVVQEVLQGLRTTAESEVLREAFLAMPVLGNPLPLERYMEAAEIYRLGRRKGYTIRSSVDCLIAAIAIENRIPVWHRDRDYRAIARFTGLEVIEGKP